MTNTKYSIVGNNPPEHTNYIDPNIISQNSLENSSVNRPSQDTTNVNNINWLGSSYSGVDIKMVAHLYTPIQATDELVRMRQELEEARSASTACQLASQGLPATLEGAAAFFGQDSATQIARLGGTTPDASAGKLIISIFRTVPRYGGWTAMRSALLNAYQSNATTFQIVADNLQAKVNTMNERFDKATNTVTLATLQTLSIQTFRSKQAVRALGQNYAKGYTRGERTIAGSMIFILFDEHSLAKLIRSMSASGSIYGELDKELSTYIADQLPPFDVTIIFANEYGSLSQMGIYGIEFISDGMTLSIEDLLTEHVLQFVARDIDIMTSKGNIKLSKTQMGMWSAPVGIGQDQNASQLLFSNKDQYGKYLERLGLRRRRTQY